MAAKRVLVVDDDLLVIRLIETALRGEDLEVVGAANGAECLLAVAAHPPDLIILDVAMPVMDGFQALRLLRDKAETASLPVIMLTARQSDADVTQGWTIGADFYLTKPFQTQELVVVIKRILEAAGSGAVA